MLSLFAALAVSGAPDGASLHIQKAGALTRLSLDGGASFHATRAQVSNGRILDLPGSTRVALWQERTRKGITPYYAISLNGKNVDAVREASYEVMLKYGTFDPRVAVPSVEPALKADSTNHIYIVQFHSQTLDEYRDALKSAGAKIHYYLPHHSYIVSMDDESVAEVKSMDFVRWVGAYEPAYRTEPEILQRLRNRTLPTQAYNIQVYEEGPVQKSYLVGLIRGIGGRVEAAIPDGYMVIATLTPDQLRQVLKLDEVFFVDRWSPLQEDMNIARDFSGANYIESIGNYRGQGVRGQVRDGGVRATHQGFATNPNTMIVRSNNTSNMSHGTNTTGIVFGNGAGNASGRGMLPEGQAIFIAGLTTGTNRYNQTAALLAAPYFAVFESNSTGSTQVTSYGTESFTMDDILFKLNILICQSQSNLGDQRSRPQAWAKNIVSVGGIKHMNTLSTADDNWTGGASIGPAQDGRVKPDLAHFYDNITCASSTTDTSYTSGFGGTSGATPITCGAFGLFFQMWADGVFGQTVTASTVFDARPMNTTAKAVMINTAAQWNFSGTAHDLTRTHQGWGRANLQGMFDRRNNMLIVDEDTRLTNLQKKTYKLMVRGTQPELKVTMVYNDPPGTTSSTQHRINDVTLKVTDPNGVVYWGNNGLLANNYSTSGGSPNTIDTVENVFVQNPMQGVWTVEVSADQINADAVVETVGVTDVDYALVASGVHAASPVLSFNAVHGSVQAGGLNELQTSNNQRLQIGAPVLKNGAYVAALELMGQGPNSKPEALRCRIESSCTAPEVNYKVYLQADLGSRRTLVGSGAVTAGDNAIEINVPNPSEYMALGTHQIKMYVEFATPNGSSNNTWDVKIDQVRWLFTP